MGSWSWAAASPWVCMWPEAVCNGCWLAFLQLRAALVKLSLWPLLPSMHFLGNSLLLAYLVSPRGWSLGGLLKLSGSQTNGRQFSPDGCE